jgi:hypothetical protein
MNSAVLMTQMHQVGAVIVQLLQKFTDGHLARDLLLVTSGRAAATSVTIGDGIFPSPKSDLEYSGSNMEFNPEEPKLFSVGDPDTHAIRSKINE